MVHVMRKLKLQMQVTVDGYVAGPEGQLDWMTFDMDPPTMRTSTFLGEREAELLVFDFA